MKFTVMVMFLVLWGAVCPGFLYAEEQQKVQVIDDPKGLKDEISKRWDVSSEKYDSHHGHGVRSGEEAEAWRELFGSLLPGNGLKILDAGCGTGEMSFLLAEMGHEVYGLDISEKMLAKAEEKAKTKAGSDGSGRVLFQLGDAENPPFENGFFDAVVSRHVLWTLPSPQKAVDSWTRVLKEDGKVIVIDALWYDDSLATRLRRQVGSWLRYLIEGQNISGSHYSPAVQASLPHAKGVPLERARAYLKQAGLQDIRDVKLERLCDIQRKHMPFWIRISYIYDYYAVCGQKRSLGQADKETR